MRAGLALQPALRHNCPRRFNFFQGWAMLTLLLCDVGNTTLKIGIANEREVLTIYSLPSPCGETSDSLGFRLLEMTRLAKINAGEIAAIVVSSVVPRVDCLLREAAERFFGCPCLFAQKDLPIPLKNHYRRPQEAGIDRLVAAFAARRLFPAAPSFVIVDYGTATTFDCVQGDAYLGGLIFPGLQTAARALSANAPRLPEVALEIGDAEIMPCQDTASGLSRGIVLGFVCLTEGLVERLAKNLRGPVKTVAAGGFAQKMGALSPVFNEVLPALALDGLRLLYIEYMGK